MDKYNVLVHFNDEGEELETIIERFLILFASNNFSLKESNNEL